MNSIKTTEMLCKFNKECNYFNENKITVNKDVVRVEPGFTSPTQKEKCLAILAKAANDQENPLAHSLRNEIIQLAQNPITQNSPDLFPLFQATLIPQKLTFFKTLAKETKTLTGEIDNLNLAQIMQSQFLSYMLEDNLIQEEGTYLEDFPFCDSIDKENIEQYLQYAQTGLLPNTQKKLTSLLKTADFLLDNRPDSLIIDKFKDFSLEECAETLASNLPARFQWTTEKILMDRIAYLCKSLSPEATKAFFLGLAEKLGDSASQLCYLSLLETNISMKELQEITKLFPKITSLNIENCQGLIERDTSYEDFNLEDLTQLKIGSSNFTHEALALFKSSLLQDLDISHSPNITELPKLPELKNLNASYTSLTNAGIASFKGSKLQDLDISRSLNITELPILPELKKLNVSYTRLNSAGIASLGSSKLQDLDISRSLKITELPILQHLLKLKAVNADLTNAGMTSLEGSLLQDLDVSHCMWMRRPPHLPNLLKLNISSTFLSEAYITSLEGSLLQDLDLSNTTTIAGLPILPQLRKLKAVNSHLTTEGIASLEHSKLQDLDIRECRRIKMRPPLPYLVKLNNSNATKRTNPLLSSIKGTSGLAEAGTRKNPRLI